MNLRGITPILNVSDIEQSLKWFESLGWKRCWTYNDGGMMKDGAGADANGPANFAAVGCGEFEVFLCRGAQGGRDAPGPKPEGAGSAGFDESGNGVWMSLWVRGAAEVDRIHQLALKYGITVTWPPTDEPWGTRECHLRHPDGHTFRISAGIHEQTEAGG